MAQFFSENKLKNGMDIIVRSAKENDASDMINYLNTIGGESDNLLFGKNEFRLSLDQEKQYLKNMDEDLKSIMLLVVLDENIVGVAQISSFNRKRIAHNGEFAISVKKEYWNMGVASILMDSIIKFAKEKIAIKIISLGVRDGNNNAIKLYEKFGFEKIGVHRNYFNINDKFYDEILMDLYIS